MGMTGIGMSNFRIWLAWRGNADGVGAAGADGAAGDGVEGLVEADFDGGEEVVAAADGDAFGGERWVGAGEERDDFVGRHGGLRGEPRKRGRDGDGTVGGAGVVEEIVGGKAGAGAVGLPLMLEKALVGVDIAER